MKKIWELALGTAMLGVGHFGTAPFGYPPRLRSGLRQSRAGFLVSVSEFKATEFGRDKNVIADTSMADEIRAIGVRKTIALTRMSQHTIEKLLRGDAVKRKTHEHVLKAIQASRRSTILESRAWSTNVKTGPERATAVAAPP